MEHIGIDLGSKDSPVEFPGFCGDGSIRLLGEERCQNPNIKIPGRVRTAYEFIKAHRDQYGVQMMCRVLIVRWAAQPTIHRELVLNAVLMAVRGRRPRGTLIHSD